MAVTKIWKIVKRLDHVIDYADNKNKTHNIEFETGNGKSQINANSLLDVINYARNSNKTEKEYFVTGINCEPESVYEEMNDTKEYFGKQDGILGFHAYQSFNEKISPELAHKIGVQFANEMWGDRFQVLVTTHLNTDHIHNHFVINSVSFKDGLKYYDNHTNYSKMRHLSDEICKEYGLSVLKEKPTKKKINYDNFYKKLEYNDTYSKNAKRDLDLAIGQAYSYDDFLHLMKRLNYDVIVRSGKLSIRKNGYKRNIRIERRYGEEYTIERIKQRILEEEQVRVPFIESVYAKHQIYPYEARHKRAKHKGYIFLFEHYRYLIKRYEQKPFERLPESMRADVIRMEELSKEAQILADNKIKTYEDLIFYEDDVQNKIKTLEKERERLWAKRKLSKDENDRQGLAEQIAFTSSEIDNLRKEVELLEDIKQRSVQIDKNLNELDTKEKEEKEKQEKKKSEKDKQKQK